MIGEGEGRREIGRAVFRRAVDAGLERIALATAETVGQAPTGATAGEREADHRVGRDAIIEAAREAGRACGEVMAAGDGEITSGAVAAAVGAAPRRPARLIDWCWRRGLLEHLGIGKRDLRRHGFARGGKAERWVVAAAYSAAAIDEGIEHHVEKLVG